MIAEKATECIEQAVCHELRNIVKKYGPTYHSEHEGFAVLKEEVEEVEECVQQINNTMKEIWSLIRKNEISHIPFLLKFLRDTAVGLSKEAIQVTAVSERFIETERKNKEEENTGMTYREDKTIL